ncbi:MAG: HlyC/CorC family transporter [Acidimicrobiia bacterium]|nr:hemolysin family protein [Acidimicrobiia bacterium]NNF10724.1 HlyC/CorC family transporter [Acidimicrobiia bacterium]NNL70235.1 HlyC/CorC family transporter [Acidimicrobiia bacterium]
MPDSVPLSLLLVGLIAMAVYLGAAEAALLRVRRSALQVQADEGDGGAARVLRLVDDLPRVMNTVLLTVLLVQIGAATVTGILAERWFGNLGVTVASILLTLLMFVYAEAIPKTFAVRHPILVARATTPVVSVLKTALHPVVSVLIWFADLQAPGQGIAGTAGVTEEELRLLAAQAASTGQIAPSDLELMERAFRVGDQRVAEILVPRIDVVAVAADLPARDALDVAIESGHRRLPVHRGDPDDITRVVRLRDLARHLAAGENDPVGKLSRDLLVVPESKRVLELLREMQRSGRHFAVAVDEHGGTAGIVTIEDVVEELVGDVADEGEERPDPIAEISSHRWRVDARVSVADLEEVVGVELPDGDWNTVGGMVLGLIGRIPRPGEVARVDGGRVVVTEASRRRVREVEFEKLD